MRALVGLATLAFIVAGVVVGVRLLRLARRTGGSAERHVGLGMLGICGLSYPLTLLVMSGALPEPAGRFVFVASTFGLAAGTICISAFVQGVFRPEESWARWLHRAIAAGWTAIALGFAVLALRTSTADLLGVGVGYFVRQVGMAVVYVWAAVEALRYWQQLRRRCVLGLAEPIVTNRVGLWPSADSRPWPAPRS